MGSHFQIAYCGSRHCVPAPPKRTRRIFNLESAYLTRIGQVIGFVCKEGLYMTFGFKNASADLCGQGLSNRRKDKFSLQYKCYFFFSLFSSEGKLEASEKRRGHFQHFFCAIPRHACLALLARSALAFTRPKNANK